MKQRIWLRSVGTPPPKGLAKAGTRPVGPPCGKRSIEKNPPFTYIPRGKTSLLFSKGTLKNNTNLHTYIPCIERKLGKGKWNKSFRTKLLSCSSPNIYATRNILAVKVWEGESSARDEIPVALPECPGDDSHAPVSGIPAAPPLFGIHRISNTFRPGDPLEIPCARHKNVSPRLIRGQSPGKMLDSKGVAVHACPSPPPPRTHISIPL